MTGDIVIRTASDGRKTAEWVGDDAWVSDECLPILREVASQLPPFEVVRDDHEFARKLIRKQGA